MRQRRLKFSLDTTIDMNKDRDKTFNKLKVRLEVQRKLLETQFNISARDLYRY